MFPETKSRFDGKQKIHFPREKTNVLSYCDERKSTTFMQQLYSKKEPGNEVGVMTGKNSTGLQLQCKRV
jgi:hypothetical protein